MSNLRPIFIHWWNSYIMHTTYLSSRVLKGFFAATVLLRLGMKSKGKIHLIRAAFHLALSVPGRWTSF